MLQTSTDNIEMRAPTEIETNVEEKVKTIYMSFQVSLISYISSLSLVLIYFLFPFRVSAMFIPYVLIDLCLFTKSFQLFRLSNSHSSFSLLVDRQIAYISRIITVSLVCVFIETETISLFISGLPLYLSVFLALYLNKTLDEPLEKLLNLVHFTIRIIQAFLFLGISMKMDGHLEWLDIMLPFIFLFGILFTVFMIASVAKKSILLFVFSVFCAIILYGCICVVKSANENTNHMAGPVLCGLIFCVLLFVFSFFFKKYALNWVARQKQKQNEVLHVTDLPGVFLLRKSNGVYELSSEGHKNEDEAQTFNEICSVCYDRNASSVFMDCYHGGVCTECALSIFKRSRTCHLCRNMIFKVYQIEAKGEVFQVTRQFELLK